MQDTIFHKIMSGELPSQKVYEDDEVFVFMDAFPISVGHTLVIAKGIEGENMYSTNPGDLDVIFRTIHRFGPKIAEAVGADGFNVVMNNGAAAGQTVFYPHVHILPMKEGQYIALPKLERSADEIAADAEVIREALK